jgi:hypothetical protein
MDRHPILDPNPASPTEEGGIPDTGASRRATASVSEGIATVNAPQHKPAEAGPRFPREDGGRSLAEMASNDLDAALQLLTERAQYITGASGAAIALRRARHNDMLCRASVGSNAPELGALLSVEYGLSGESVRTRQTLRCDDTERDPRVNREGCRQLGIASVVVMPIVRDEQVLGVFELFSAQPLAFGSRDLSALQRLSEMVGTAVKHAMAAKAMPAVAEPADAEPQPPAAATPRVAPPVAGNGRERRPAAASNLMLNLVSQQRPENEAAAKARTTAATSTSAKTRPEPTPKKPLFWSAAMRTQASAAPAAGESAASESIAVPPVLRNLQKCQACGFPVSQGRTFCVECEEKQWRGQPLMPLSKERPSEAAVSAAAVVALAPIENLPSTAAESAAVRAQTSVAPDVPGLAADTSPSDASPRFLTSAASSPSWFAANKYVLGALLVVAIVIGAIVWLR